MDEDYELRNAREWDPRHEDDPTPTTSRFRWKVVEPERKHQPARPPINNLKAFDTNRQREPPKQFPNVAKAPEPVRKRDPPNNVQNNLPRQWQNQAPPNNAQNNIVRQWQTSGPVRRGHYFRREAPRLLEDSDNDAEASWRARQPPALEVRIPDDMLLTARSSDVPENYHERIAQQHGTFVYSHHPKGNGGTRTFGIWGDRKAVEATRRAIADWIEEAGFNQKSARSLRFAKVQSLTPALRERAEKRWEREVKRQRYRQHPPPDLAFGSIGSLHWPVTEYKPQEVLGVSAEALDPIRMEFSCFIVYNKERNIFNIMGKASDVQAGLRRMRQVCFQLASKNYNPTRQYELRWPDTAKVPLYVYLKQYEPPVITFPQSDEDPKTRKAPRGEEYEDNEDTIARAETQNALSNEHLRSAILRTLHRLHYYNGSVQLRIRLGTFLVDQYKAPDERYGVYDLEEYESMVRESQFSGEVTQELGDSSTEQALLQAVQSASDLLTPLDATTIKLKDVKPSYAATFTFDDPKGHYRLTVEWHQTLDAYGKGSINFDEASKKWTRLERDASAPTSLLDVSLCDLNTSSAWHFDILAAPQVVDEARLPQQLANFARNLKIDRDAALKVNGSDLFVRFNQFISLASVQQRINYQYFIADSDFTLEVSRFQDRVYPTRSGSRFTTQTATQPIVYESRWSLNVFREHWDTMLAKNERLPIGEHADWPDDVATWFPADVGPGSAAEDDGNANQGWEQLMGKLAKIEGLVASAKTEDMDEDEEEGKDLMGGMTVG